MKITNHTVVSLRYTMQNNQGEIIESNIASSPIEYLHGAGTILPALETELEGAAAGAEKSFTIHMEDNQPFQFEVIIDAIRPATPQEIQQGKPAKPVQENNCGPTCCC
jgi:FKBP-type peptidyl-prolyl cis-trans isomerase SlyD